MKSRTAPAEPATRPSIPAAEAASRHTDHGRSQLHAAGTLLTIAGVAGLSLGVLDAMNLLPLAVARWRVQSESLLILISVLLLLAGLRLTWLARHTATRMKPAAPGMRFHTVVLYSRAECGLCDEARETLAVYREYLPPLVEVDIDGDPALQKKFGTCIPVVEVDGKVRFRGRVSEVLLRRLIDRTEPINTPTRGPILRRRR